MLEHHLHLTRRIFRDQRPGRQALDLRKGVEIGEKWCKIIEILEIVGLVMQRPRGHGQPLGSLRVTAQGGIAVHQEEFELDRPDRHHALLAQPRIHPAQQIARIGHRRRPVKVVHGCDILRRGFGRPGHGHQRPRHRPQQEIAVALVEYEPGFRDVLAGDVENHCRNRQIPAILPCRRQVVPPEQLAALHAAEIRPHQMEGADVRELRQEGLGLQGAVRDDDRHAAASRLRSGPGL